MVPIAFRDEFVLPAIEFWREQPNQPVRAACAISQIDILAEVVAIDQSGGQLPRGGAGPFRDDLGQREPALARIRDAHDSHKHGHLSRRSATEISEGQRAYRSAGTAVFLGRGVHRSRFFGRTSTAILHDNGEPIDIGTLIREAMEAWDRELHRLGYLPPAE
ncbi:hypothetical protein [Methylorubrum extorquens]|uniref:hypothetical protein n=1 Tax=Methylorubrum extorquens TaxID=408 RepID=UPI0013010283|nr:hypothetical protein [Methylorubrum extorquens]MCP1591996.1 hypothetical protein [Methylorubrum extorquens]